MRQPAAPYHEHGTRSAVESICADHDLECRRDRWGNLLVGWRTAPKLRPLVLVAHLDHPGFEIQQRLGPKRWRARFLGGVGDMYFRKGVPVRLMPGGTAARLGKRIGKAKEFELIASAAPAVSPQFAVWELEDFTLRRGRIHGRACDDLIGVASILATIIELKRRRVKTHVLGLITRAEEVGFQGALVAAASKQLPPEALVVSLETSREMPPVKMGRGVILRVGDRASIFDSRATRFLAEVAGAEQKRNPAFRFQRALMSGGTCEATAFQEHGYQTAALCVALGNYHNCAPRNRIAAEYVSLADAHGMVRLLVCAARRLADFAALTSKLPARLRQLEREGRAALRKRR